MTSRYRELAPDADLAGHLQCVWTSVVERAPATAHVLPDACIDILWFGGQLIVAGPDTGSRLVSMPPGTSIAAVRFRPGAAPALLGMPATAILDQTVPLAELWGRSAADRLAERLAEADCAAARRAGAAGRQPGAGGGAEPLPERRAGRPTEAGDGTTPFPESGGGAARVAVLQAELRRRLPGAAPVDPLTGGVVAELGAAAGAGVRSVGGLADIVGLSERQLHRRCRAAFGYGPKTLDRVLRLQRFLALGRHPGRRPGGLAGLAADAGYADQAHLAHECRRLAGATPAALLA